MAKAGDVDIQCLFLLCRRILRVLSNKQLRFEVFVVDACIVCMVSEKAFCRRVSIHAIYFSSSISQRNERCLIKYTNCDLKVLVHQSPLLSLVLLRFVCFCAPVTSLSVVTILNGHNNTSR